MYRVSSHRGTSPGRIPCVLSCALALSGMAAAAEPNPVLSSVFPPGACAGTEVVITLAGAHLEGLSALQCNLPGLRAESIGANQFRLAIPQKTAPGQYDLQAVTAHGLSSVRTFVVGTRVECLEVEPNNSPDKSQPVSLNGVVNGRIEKGDLDYFSFTAQRGQRVVIECGIL